jgi:phage I-like protein
MALLTALLSATLALTGSAGKVQVIPAGEFAARDGRPGPGQKWRLSDAQGQQLATHLNGIAALTPLVIDYEHQTYLAEENGLPAPAAGFMTRFEWRSAAGLWADVDWTVRAKGYIDAGEYRFFSPVLQYDPDTGRVVGIENGALTNHPALLGMAAVQARLRAAAATETPLPLPHTTAQKEPLSMELLEVLRALFALPTATAEQLHTHVATLKAKAETDAAAVAAAGAELVKLKATLGLPTEGDCGTALAVLKAKADKGETAEPTLVLLRSVQTELATLRTQVNEKELTELVEAAIPTKFVPAMREQLLAIGRKDLAQLKTLVAAAPANTALTQGQSGGKAPPAADPAAPLTEAELAMCRACGVSPEDFKKQKKAMA